MPVKRGNTDVTNIKNKGISMSIKAKSKDIFPSYADDYINRVENDGGSITDEDAVREVVDILVSNDIWPHVQGVFSPAFGIKVDGSNKLLKLYNVKQDEDIVPFTLPAHTFDVAGRNGNPILTASTWKEIECEGGEDWLRDTGLGWCSVACYLPMATGGDLEAFEISHDTNFARRFCLNRDGSEDDRLDFVVNPDDDFTVNTLGDDEDDVASFMEFSGFVDLVDQYMHSLKDQQTLREFQGSPLPSKKFPDTPADSIYSQTSEFGFLLFANMRPTVAQRNAVFNWLDNYYAIT